MDESEAMDKKRIRKKPIIPRCVKYHFGGEVPGVALMADGSIQVRCADVRLAEKVALRLHKRQSRMMLLDYCYR